MEKKGKLITAAAILFSIATFMFLLALLAFVLGYAVVAETNTTFYALGTLGAYALFDTYGAVFVLLSGIGLAGWIRSKATGIAILALIFTCLKRERYGGVGRVNPALHPLFSLPP